MLLARVRVPDVTATDPWRRGRVDRRHCTTSASRLFGAVGEVGWLGGCCPGCAGGGSRPDVTAGRGRAGSAARIGRFRLRSGSARQGWPVSRCGVRRWLDPSRRADVARPSAASQPRLADTAAGAVPTAAKETRASAGRDSPPAGPRRMVTGCQGDLVRNAGQGRSAFAAVSGRPACSPPTLRAWPGWPPRPAPGRPGPRSARGPPRDGVRRLPGPGWPPARSPVRTTPHLAGQAEPLTRQSQPICCAVLIASRRVSAPSLVMALDR